MENNILTFRCSQCVSIPMMRIMYQKGKVYIEYRCENDHYDYEEIKSFYKRNLNNNYEGKFYCFNCNKFLDENVISKHNEKHKLFHYDNIDGICKKNYENNVNNYCNKCKMNICSLCQYLHEEHELKNLKKMLIPNKKLNEYKNNIKKTEEYLKIFNNKGKKILNDLNNYIQLLNNSFNKFQELNEIELEISKNLINKYENMINNNKINYESIKNIENIINFKEIKFDIDENFNLLTIIQKFYTLINNDYNSILNISKNLINTKNQITEKDKNFLMNLPPLPNNENLKYIEEYNSDREEMYYGEINPETKKRNGRGLVLYKNGNKSIGYWKEDKKTGYGIFYYLLGDCYEGNYVDDIENGFGKITYKDGEEFIGISKDDKIHGYGIRKYINGEKYMGSFEDKNYNGFGIKYGFNGDKYYGFQKNNVKDGYGIKEFGYGGSLIGKWENDKINFGTYIQRDNWIYQGDLININKNGYGILFNSQGVLKYEGGWKNNN